MDIDEADVGQVWVGQTATFTVDAWPGRKYTGVITRGRLRLVDQGHRRLPTVLAVSNDDLSLRPGMTSTADIVTVTHAFEREVLLQLLIEAAVLSGIGGLLGIALATCASMGLASLMGIPYPSINALSFLFSAVIGVVFGFFPARRAAGLNSIDALRYE